MDHTKAEGENKNYMVRSRTTILQSNTMNMIFFAREFLTSHVVDTLNTAKRFDKEIKQN